MLKKNQKKLGRTSPEDTIIGFLDESSPRTTANTVRLWSFGKPVMIKNTSMYRANTFGFDAYNGKSVVNKSGDSKQESIIDFLDRIKVDESFQPNPRDP
jgi:hypothetical protein